MKSDVKWIHLEAWLRQELEKAHVEVNRYLPRLLMLASDDGSFHSNGVALILSEAKKLAIIFKMRLL